VPQSIHQKFGSCSDPNMGAEKFARCHGGEESVESTGLDHTQIVISAAEHVAVAVVCESNLRTADVWMFCARVTGLIPISILLPRRFGQTFKMTNIVRWMVFDAALLA